MLAIAGLVCCSRNAGVPDQPDIQRFIEAASAGIYVESAYAHDPEILASELDDIQWPGDFEAFADSLLERYGSDPEFWYPVFSAILEKSHR